MPAWGTITLTTAVTVMVNALILAFWKRWLGAYGGEKGKNLAGKQDLYVILNEVRGVTTAQKEIETKLSSDHWDRQTQWNHKRDTYVRLLEAVQKTALIATRIEATCRAEARKAP